MKAIGIDLGTTNTVTAIHHPDGKVTEVVENGEAKPYTPSVVGVHTRKTGEEATVVGQDAVDGAGNATCTVFSVKRLMGRGVSEPEIADVRKRFHYEIVPASPEDPTAAIRMGSTVRTPPEISSLILRKVCTDVARSLGGQVTHAVITVPAYFEVAQRAATRKAAEAAGLKVKRLIDEPTAAAIAFGMREAGTTGKRVLVYDLGGGTFDISLLQMVQDQDGRSHFHVVGAAGDNWLGGDDFDHLIVDKVLEEVRDRLGTAPPDDQRFRRAVKEHSEKVKWKLSNQDFAVVNIPGAFRMPADDGPLIDVYVEFTREQANRMFAPLVARTMALVDDVLAEGNFTAEDITDVLLVGGSTLMASVREAVIARFGVGKVRMGVKPMECVALGAAILASTETGLECPSCETANGDDAESCQNCDHSLLEVGSDDGIVIYEQTAMALGIAAIDGDNSDAFVEIIPRGTKYPLREPMKKMFTAAARRVRIPVHEGVHKVASKNRVQGVVEVELPEGLEPNSDVEVSFNYDRDRVVTVMVRVPGTTFVQATTLHPHVVDDRPPAADDAKEDLERSIDLVEDFLVRFDSYLEPFHGDRIKGRLVKAKAAFRGDDSAEHRRFNGLLLRDLDSAGLATTLYYADIVADRAEPADSERIRRTAQTVREAHEQRNEARRAHAEKILRELIERELRKLSGDTMADASDLLRTPHSATSR
ncbi:Hsp70 family protein [Actinocrispum wychmicini]|uniref:Molecular chaperone DnaK n=1 Tax=Actinocrispum wychmicini TaxID=1213861 RepID=A0A4V2S818_9PSEU|nr:Hsp70 family protein [Actinocrispum wychmicini]TCO62170.1 molecular chaperone DnaK [Actinocrispum wychmicini]